MIRLIQHHLSLLIVCAITTGIHAMEETTGAVTEPAAPSVFGGNLGLIVANQYNTDGFIVQGEGVSFQPYLDLYATFYEGGDWINSATVFLGLWTCISSETLDYQRNKGNHFTEFDYGIGLSINFADRWVLTSFYNRWTSPADAYPDGHWINATVEFDDEGLISEKFSLKPYLTIKRELVEYAEGLHFEPGIQPNYTFFSKSDTPVTVALLIKAGLEQFNDFDTYGYLAYGPQVSFPLRFLDSTAGEWTVTASYLYYDFGDTLESFNQKGHDHMLSFSMSVTF